MRPGTGLGDLAESLYLIWMASEAVTTQPTLPQAGKQIEIARFVRRATGFNLKPLPSLREGELLREADEWLDRTGWIPF